MKLLKRIASFFRAFFSQRREEGSPHKKVGYIVDQLKIVVETVESYKLSYVMVSMGISSQEEMEEIKKELDRRENLTYSMVEEEKRVKLYLILRGEKEK